MKIPHCAPASAIVEVCSISNSVFVLGCKKKRFSSVRFVVKMAES